MKSLRYLLTVLLLMLAKQASATITHEYNYPLGETGSLGAAFLPLDTGGEAFHFTTVTDGSGAEVSSAGMWAPESTAYLRTSALGWSAPNLFSGLATNDFAFGVFARTPTIQAGGRDIMTLGDTTGALKLSISEAGWGASVHNENWIGPAAGVVGSFASSQWVHLALVRRGGVCTFYLNGQASGTWGGLPVHGTPLLAMSPDRNSFFNGDLDQARVVTFDSNSDDSAVLSALWGATSLPSSQPIVEQTFATTKGKRYIAVFTVSAAAGQATLPGITLGVSGDAPLLDQILPTQLPLVGSQAPFRIAFTADSAQSTVKLTSLSPVSLTASGMQVLPAIECIPSNQPSVLQQAQIDRRYGMFIHYGINTFADQEWTDGSIPASSYAPTGLEVDQWVKSARDAGMRHIILTAKHHEGFCIWDSPWTNYDVGASSVTTDVVAAAAVACKKYGIGLGIYYSYWDRHSKIYDDDAAYGQYMLRQLAELLGNYGPICELWLDGGGNKSIESRWPNSELYDLMKRLQPDCLVSSNWGSCGPTMSYFPSDFRTADPYLQVFPDSKMRSHNGKNYYMPYEATVTLSGSDYWFFKTWDNSAKPLSTLANLFYSATAQDNILILNAAPNRSGVIREVDRQRLFELRDLLGIQPGMPMPKVVTGSFTGYPSATWADDVTNYGPQLALDGDPATRWASGPSGITSATFDIDFGSARTFDRLLMDEFDEGGGYIQGFQLQSWTGSDWQTFHTGTTCGRYKIENFSRQTTTRLRILMTNTSNAPSFYELRVFDSGHAFSTWRSNNFSGPETLASAEMDADPDLDGLPNRLEFALGSNPNRPNNLPSPADNGLMKELRLPWNSQASADFGSVSYSLDLVNWCNASNPQHDGVSAMSSVNGQRVWQIDPTKQPKWFYRVN